jgi:hypothetical protein
VAYDAVFVDSGPDPLLGFIPERVAESVEAVPAPAEPLLASLGLLTVSEPEPEDDIEGPVIRLASDSSPRSGVRPWRTSGPRRAKSSEFETQRSRVSVVFSAAGGAAAGALAMWLFGVRTPPLPAQMNRGTPAVVATAHAAPEPPVAFAVEATSIPVERPLDAPTPLPTAGDRAVPSDVPAGAAARRTSSRDRRLPAPRVTGFRGTLSVRSEPSRALVFVNGRAVGSTPLVLKELPIGSRAVRVEAEGYRPWSAAVRVVANEQTPVTAHLDRAP